VPEVEVRINIYSRLVRLDSAAAISVFEEEIEDRFGPPPTPLVNLFQLARVKASCRELGIERLDAGPRAVAATLRHEPSAAVLRAIERGRTKIEWRGERLVYPHGSKNVTALTAIAMRFIEQLGEIE
jgi:transcription-repair coupling factor (superfamily II helicase)